jgi:hypothetical protein
MLPAHQNLIGLKKLNRHKAIPKTLRANQTRSERPWFCSLLSRVCFIAFYPGI